MAVAARTAVLLVGKLVVAWTAASDLRLHVIGLHRWLLRSLREWTGIAPSFRRVAFAAAWDIQPLEGAISKSSCGKIDRAWLSRSALQRLGDHHQSHAVARNA